MKQMEEVIKGYHELVDYGRREIYRLENEGARLGWRAPGRLRERPGRIDLPGRFSSAAAERRARDTDLAPVPRQRWIVTHEPLRKSCF